MTEQTEAYAFIIDQDYLAEGNLSPIFPSIVGTILGTSMALREKFQSRSEEGRRFRLYDDDDELYYEGRLLTLEAAGTELDFAPLDWAASDSGCTRIDYWNEAEQKWETL